MHRDLPLMIFAAGFGTRMGALTADRPKPLIPVNGRTLLSRAAAIARAAGCAPIVANTHHLADKLSPELASLGIDECREAPEILDTGGGLKAALDRLPGDPVATLNPDAVWRGPNPLSWLAGQPWPAGAEALLLLVPHDHAMARIAPGDFARDAGGRLARKGSMVYTGAQIIRRGAVARETERVFSLNLVWDRMIAEGTLFGAVYPGTWCDVGHPAAITVAEALLAEATDGAG